MTLHTGRSDEGFSLIELLVVIIILGLLATIALPVFMGQRDRARMAAVNSDIRNAAILVMSIEDPADRPNSWQELVDAGHRPTRDLTPAEGAQVVVQADPPCISIAHSATPDEPYRAVTSPYLGVVEGSC